MRTLVALSLVLSLPASGVLAQAGAATTPVVNRQDDWRSDARAMSARGIDWLRTQQDPSGAWCVAPDRPAFPAITALIAGAMIEQAARAGVDPSTDPAIASAVKYILSKRQPDGGIYDKLLPSYNTAICATTLARIDTPEARDAVAKAADFLKNIQYSEGVVITDNPDQGQKVDPSHPYYGGWGYGKHGRPDISNTAFAIEALHAAGVSEEDPAFKRALVFLKRLQMDGTINDMDYAKGSRQGGFIYAAGTNQNDPGSGLSYSAGQVEETLDNGEKVSRMRAYGSVTYQGFKSLIYAGLSREDPRVQAAMRWISDNYTVEENPGMGAAGQYYYYLAMARALDAVGAEFVNGPEISREFRANPDRADRPAFRWGQDLTTKLRTLQSDDGSFRSLNPRWMEDNQVLITAYSVLALQAASRDRGQR
jgi:squalene-hopene/tetraprenyl-beta-curcumene cyclase